MFATVLVLNGLWFGTGFCYFGLAPATAAKLLVPPSARGAPLFATVAAAVRFLGGLNLAFAALAGLVLLNRGLVPAPAQRALFAGVFALAHATQVGGNLPGVLGGGRQGGAPWPVRSGPMRLIFAVDLTLMVANAAVSAALLMRPR